MGCLITCADNNKEKHRNINRTGCYCFTGTKLPSDSRAEWSLNVTFDAKQLTNMYLYFSKDGATEMAPQFPD